LLNFYKNLQSTKERKKLVLSTVLFSSILFSFYPFNNEPVSASGNSFSVEKISIPEENKTDTFVNWYEIDKNKFSGKEIILKFSLVNHSNENKEILIEPRDAFAQTNQMLNITYPSIPNLKYTKIIDPSFNFKQFVKEKKLIVDLKPNEEKKIEVNIDVPNTKGDLLGAISFKENKLTDDLKKEKENIGTSFLIESEYIIAVHLIDSTQVDKPYIFTKARPYLEPSRFVIEFDVENPTPKVNIQKVNYSILNDDKKTLFSNETPLTFKSPPMTKTSFRVPWADKKAKAGKYFLKINDTLLPFEIKKEKIKDIKDTIEPEQILMIEPNNNIKFWFILIGSILLNAILFIFIFKFIRKNK
jgi:hypothetical protein